MSTTLTFSPKTRVPALNGSCLTPEAMVSYMQALFNVGLLYDFDADLSDNDIQRSFNVTGPELERLKQNHQYIWTKQPDLYKWIESNRMLSDALDNLIKLSLVRN